MKGLTFQNGIEYRIQIQGESWSQGDTLTGTLESKPSGKLRVVLAEGNDKKVKSKSEDAFTLISETDAASSPLQWSFTLNRDARISDKSGSLYLLYGNSDSLISLGQLKLPILPHQHIVDFVDVMTHHFRFALKSINMAKKGFVEIKLTPSGSKEWASLEQLVLLLKLTDTEIENQWIFHRQMVDATSGSLSSKLVKKEYQKPAPLQTVVHDFNQRLNKDAIIQLGDLIISEYQNSSWI